MKSKPLTRGEMLTNVALTAIILAILAGGGYYYFTGHAPAYKPKNGYFGVKNVHV